MTPQHNSSDLPALDELGRRFEVAVARDQAPSPRGRRTLLAVAAGLVALAATPAVASIVGDFNSHSSIEEAVPRAAAVIDPDDPLATGRELRKLGFDVQWSFVQDNPGGDSPTTAREVAAPPPGTEILAVLASDGSSQVTEDTRALLIEVAPADSEIIASHP